MLETDCQALQWLKEQAHPPARLARWMLKLSEFSFEIKHKAGRKNGNADGLSRLPLHNCCALLTSRTNPYFPMRLLQWSVAACLKNTKTVKALMKESTTKADLSLEWPQGLLWPRRDLFFDLTRR